MYKMNDHIEKIATDTEMIVVNRGTGTVLSFNNTAKDIIEALENLGTVSSVVDKLRKKYSNINDKEMILSIEHFVQELVSLNIFVDDN